MRALLAARLDRLEPDERRMLECAAIAGEVFHRAGVQALATGESPVTPRLASLVRKGLIEPTWSALEGEDEFRFRHVLIRDAAYDALPKERRADLHRRLADWLESRPGPDLPESYEVIGYHLEQACA
jgi:predicted ATPase